MHSSDATPPLDESDFIALSKVLQEPATPPPPLVRPASPTDGTVHSWLMHQGKSRGEWSRGWFVLKGPWLHQYASQRSSQPRASFYVSFAMVESLSQSRETDSISNEMSSLHHAAFEELTYTLRITVYTPTNVKLLSASSGPALHAWYDGLRAEVALHTEPEALQAKERAAEALHPVLTAQLLSEEAARGARFWRRAIARAPTAEADPRRSVPMAKAGNLKLLTLARDGAAGGADGESCIGGDRGSGDSGVGVGVGGGEGAGRGSPSRLTTSLTKRSEPRRLRERKLNKLYVCLLGEWLYFYDEAPLTNGHNANGHAGACGAGRALPWKGCLHLAYATVTTLHDERGGGRRAFQGRAFELMTPLRTLVFLARHTVDRDAWVSALCAAQEGRVLGTLPASPSVLDVYHDALADALRNAPTAAPLELLLAHPLGRWHFGRYLDEIASGNVTDAASIIAAAIAAAANPNYSPSRSLSPTQQREEAHELRAALEVLETIAEYKRCAQGHARQEVVARIESAWVAVMHDALFKNAIKSAIKDVIKDADYFGADDETFAPVEKIILRQASRHVEAFRISAHHGALHGHLAPKQLRIWRAGASSGAAASAEAPTPQPTPRFGNLPELSAASASRRSASWRSESDANTTLSSLDAYQPCGVYSLEGTIVLGRADPPPPPKDRHQSKQHVTYRYVQLWQPGDDGKVSRTHCRIDCGALAVQVTDLGSARGTHLGTADGELVRARMWLPGEALFVGAYRLEYKLDTAPQPPNDPVRPSRRSLLKRFVAVTALVSRRAPRSSVSTRLAPPELYPPSGAPSPLHCNGSALRAWSPTSARPQLSSPRPLACGCGGSDEQRAPGRATEEVVTDAINYRLRAKQISLRRLPTAATEAAGAAPTDTATGAAPTEAAGEAPTEAAGAGKVGPNEPPIRFEFGPGPLGIGLSDAVGGGAFIAEVHAGGAAEQQGMRVGCFILALAGIDVRHVDKRMMGKIIGALPRPLEIVTSLPPAPSSDLASERRRHD